MPDKTDNFGLQILIGEDVSTDGYAYTYKDRILLDKLIKTLFLHRHDDKIKLINQLDDATPYPVLNLTMAESGGAILAGLSYFYRVSFLNESGLETSACIEREVAMPNPVVDPTPSLLNYINTGGTLLPDEYTYGISVIKGAGETLAATTIINIPYETNTNKVNIAFPTPPEGATHWNIYRKKGISEYYYLAQVVVAQTSFVDGGSIAPDITRAGLPISNTTNSTNMATITISEMPTNATYWAIYRTDIPAYYTTNSLLAVLDSTTLTFNDTGQVLSFGTPRDTDATSANPSKININAETINQLLTSRISPLSSDLDFAKFKALQFVIASGTTFPTTPVLGQKFYLTTDKILYIFNGTAWESVGNCVRDYTKCSFLANQLEETIYDKITIDDNIVVKRIDVYCKVAVAGGDANNYVTIRLEDNAATPNICAINMQSGNYFTQTFNQEYLANAILTLKVAFTQAATPLLTNYGENVNITIHYIRKQITI